ncbi:alpha-pore-forming tripartite toxin MakABE regulator [Pseudomonas rubra]|uniref:Uncharacterized protein n=1 Tax=Pseudomonas rubra TaxID=2942627 RepID=A0ABT5PBV0_9PSED|nr:hypothetical protein [Pseudomonas rubra]MDD1015700.1 hypothetical protein [Pseudomonas rubra]MDD1040322.1 hypothetical protein [Pseudomonas rubra]MDD1153913.1 hypothetical protein [Pseudomonas rubra]
MKTIYVLVVVDTAGALASRSAIDNAYLVDTNGFLGSWQEGTPVLHTVCEDGDLVCWTVIPIASTGDVSIAGFSGAMLEQGVCRPTLQSSDGNPWLARVESRGQFVAFSYVLTLAVGGVQLSLNAQIKVI